MSRISVATVVTRFIAGAGGVALRGALALDREEVDVSIFAADEGPLLAQAESAGLRVVRLRHMRHTIEPAEDCRCLRELVSHLSDGQYDIVHTHSAKAGALGRIAARKADVPAVVHTFHGFPFHPFQSALRRSTYLALERRLGKLTDRFLAIGTSVAADIVRLRIGAPHQVRVIAPAVSSDVRPVTRLARAEARRLLQVPPGVRLIGAVGRLDEQKAPDHMIQALIHLGREDAHLVWVGDGPLRQAVVRRVVEAGLRDRVRLLGERSDVAALLPAFDVFAMSSLYEGLPCSLVEAMLCGVPVVATAVNSVPDVVVPGQTGTLVPAGRPAALASGLRHALDEPAEAAEMAQRGRSHLGSRFSPELLGWDLAETYRSVLNNRSVVPTAASRVSFA